IADYGNSRIRRVDASGIITTVAGITEGQFLFDGANALQVRLAGPTGVAPDRNGNVYFVEGSVGLGSGLARGDFRVWEVAQDGVLHVVAGTGLESFSGDGGAAAAAQFNEPK